MEIVTSIAPLLLALIMLGLGLELTINDFKRVLQIPKDFLVGFFCVVGGCLGMSGRSTPHW